MTSRPPDIYEFDTEAYFEKYTSFHNDTLGHLDYVCRKAPYRDPLLHYGEFPEYIDEILKLLAKKGKSLEINTRLFGNTTAVKELEIICGRFAQLGGETVTTFSRGLSPASSAQSAKRWVTNSFQQRVTIPC